MKRLIVDLDGTLTIDDPSVEYTEKRPNNAIIAKLKEYKDAGFEIIIMTSRQMRTYGGSIGKINAVTLPAIIDWLRRYEVPYDEVHVGKPWCGNDGFYVDDKAVRPSEFLDLNYDEIRALIDSETRLSE